MSLLPAKTRRLFGANVQQRKYCITKQDSALFGLFKSYFTQGLFSWRNEDPSTRNISEVGSSSQRHMFSEFSLHAKDYTCAQHQKIPCTRIFLAEKQYRDILAQGRSQHQYQGQSRQNQWRVVLWVITANGRQFRSALLVVKNCQLQL